MSWPQGGRDPVLDRLLIRLHTDTACRRGGTLALRVKDLDTRYCRALLREKDGTYRWQPITPTLAAALDRHAAVREAADPTIALSRQANGVPLTTRRYDLLWRRVRVTLPWPAPTPATPTPAPVPPSPTSAVCQPRSLLPSPHSPANPTPSHGRHHTPDRGTTPDRDVRSCQFGQINTTSTPTRCAGMRLGDTRSRMTCDLQSVSPLCPFI
jgi:hypothetical protein